MFHHFTSEELLLLIIIFAFLNLLLGERIGGFSYEFFWKNFSNDNGNRSFGGKSQQIIAYLIWPNFVFKGMPGDGPRFVSHLECKNYILRMMACGIVPMVLFNVYFYFSHLITLIERFIDLCCLSFYFFLKMLGTMIDNYSDEYES